MAEQEVITSEKPKLTPEELIVHDSGEYAMLFDSAKFNQAWRVAQAFATSGLVPEHFKNNTAGVFVVLHMATRLDLDPFMALQKVYMVHGRPGMEAQLIIALVNARGPFHGPIQWETDGVGDKRQWTAYATHKATGERCEVTVTWAMVTQEGWNKDKPMKSGGVQKSKWNTLPDLMGRYRSATFLARLFCPEVILGLSTADELEDMAITLDSGVTVSHRPKTALPEPPEVDPAAVDEFDKEISARKLNKETGEALSNFVSEIAKVNKQTPEAVKAQAGTPENFPTFWQSFLTWQNKPKRGRPLGKSPEPPPAPPDPEAPTQAQETEENAPGEASEPPNPDSGGDSGPDLNELLDKLAGQGWPVAKLEVRLGKKAVEWGLAELSKLADLSNEFSN
jgi:hypothetical protein